MSFTTTLVGQQVDAGNGHTIILEDKGNVFAIGRNNVGQLGDSSLNNCNRPVKPHNLPKIASIPRGYDHSLALDSSGKVWSWGLNNYVNWGQ
jgi:alpha-tubulin suppressor-like RCC1 family protein